MPPTVGAILIAVVGATLTEPLRIPNRHDTGSTSPRSVGEVALIWDTISHYSPVLIAPLANFIAPARPEKNKLGRAGMWNSHNSCIMWSAGSYRGENSGL